MFSALPIPQLVLALGSEDNLVWASPACLSRWGLALLKDRGCVLRNASLGSSGHWLIYFANMHGIGWPVTNMEVHATAVL